MAIATKCTCGYSITGVCTSSVKECRQLRKENTQLPKEVVSQIEKDAEAAYIELYQKVLNLGDGFAMPKFNMITDPIEKVLTAYATQLHQANETIKVLTYDNNRLKGEVEGLRIAVEELKGNYKQPALPADDAVQNWFEENIDKECSASSAIYKFRQWLESLQVGWTPADTKPEHNVGVLVFIPGEDNHITSGMWDIDNKWVLLDEYRTPEEEVTHWMPLPSFPKGYTWNEIPDELVDALKKVAKDEIGKRESAAGRESDAVDLIEYIRNNYKPSKEVWQDKFGIALLSDEGVLSKYKQQKEK